MWNAEGKVRNEKKERRWYGSQIRPCDCSCYAVYHTPRVADAAVNCIMQMCKFYACYPNFDLSFAINWKVLRNDTNKNYYCCVWRYCRYSQGLQYIMLKAVFPAVYLWVSVKRTCHEAIEATNQSWCPEIQSACGAGMEQVISRCCGCCICEPVQEQIGQVLAKIWALKAWLNQPIIRQVTS